MRKFLCIAACALLAVAITAARADAEQKFGFIDMQRALNEVEEGKKAKANLKKDFDQKQQMLDQKQDELKKLKDDLDKQALVIKDEAKRERMGELQQKFIDLQQLYGKLQKELSEKELGLTKEIFDKMEGIIAEIAQKEGLTMIFEKNESRILFAPPSMDFTNDLIRKYNGKYGSGGGGGGDKKDGKKK